MEVRARGLGLVDEVRVGLDGGLLEVPDEAVDHLGIRQVRRREDGPHRELGRDDEGARDGRGVEHLEADEEVHALVLGLLEKREDGAVVALERAERVEVPEPRRDEAGHAGERLEDDEPPRDRVDRRVLGLVARHEVEPVVQRRHRPPRDAVRQRHGAMLRRLDVLELRRRPNVVRLPPRVARDDLLRQRRHRRLLLRDRLGRQRAVRRVPATRPGGGRHAMMIAFESSPGVPRERPTQAR
mmetsp:Transcript_22210/g.88134  ORF Transcript_22210/g.88134 Transcript_22210/m.88134 type:complete len:241 (+) Transcript_22210:1441-2163(+)